MKIMKKKKAAFALHFNLQLSHIQAPVLILLFKRRNVRFNGLCPFFCRKLVRNERRFNCLSRDRKGFFPCKCVAGHDSRC